MFGLDPFYLYLTAMVLGAVWIGIRAQRDPNFSFLDMFKDENSKPSFLRAVIPPTWIISSVVLIWVVKHDDPEDFTFYLTYLAVWSGAPVAAKALEVAASIWGKKGT